MCWQWWGDSSSVWIPRGKLVGNDYVEQNIYRSFQGGSVGLSFDGSTAIVGGPGDNYRGGAAGVGAAWIYTRDGNAWIQQGPKLVGAGATNDAAQGESVAISGDGNVAVMGAIDDGFSTQTGATWAFSRTDAVWTQQGAKFVGSGGLAPQQGFAVALSADGQTAIVGGPADNAGAGAVWIFSAAAPTASPSAIPVFGPLGILALIGMLLVPGMLFLRARTC